MDYKRVLLIQDISCVGQCSMTVALPVLCAWGHETCILPTSILSTHTGGFTNPVVHNMSADLDLFWRHWLREGITFDTVVTGYLGSADAAKAAIAISQELLVPGGELIVDPAMADHGRLYSGLDNSCVQAMMELCTHADILLPNVTEACMLAGLPYREKIDEAYVKSLLQSIDCTHIVITGVGYSPEETGVEIWENRERDYYKHTRFEGNFHGTGDLFTACFAGARLSGKSVTASAHIAEDVTALCIENTVKAPAHKYGTRFESALPALIKRINS